MKKRSILLVGLSFIVALGFASILMINPAGSQKIDAKPLKMINYMPSDSYEDDWKRVDSLEKKGLYKSALELVNGIYSKSEGEKNHPQQIKSLLHILKYTQAVEEEAEVKNIARMRAEIAKASFPMKPLLQSILAGQFWSYYQQNQWRFLDRTETEALEETDIRTWDLRKLITEVSTLHEAALSNRDSLQRTSIDYFDEVLVKNLKGRPYRPTLYDFLAHRALEVFQNDVLGLSKPAFQFQIKEAAAFGSDEDFVRINFTSRDTASFKLKAIRIYQELTHLHLRDDDPGPATMLALDRLAYVRANAGVPQKEQHYREALEKLHKLRRKHAIGTSVAHQLALWHRAQASNYDPFSKDQKYKKANQIAYDICEAASKSFPDTDGARNCLALQLQISEKEMDLSFETINLPGKPFRGLLSYQNLEKVWFRIVKVAEKDRPNMENRGSEEQFNFLLKKTPVESWGLDLPNDPDFNKHNVEIPIPELETGYYAILCADNEKFSFNQNAVALNLVWSSRLAYSSRSLDNASLEVFIYDRETGQPLTDVAAQMFTQDYDYNKRRYNYKPGGTYRSDKEGFLEIPAPSGNSTSFYLEFNYGGLKIRTDDSWYLYYNKPRAEKHQKQTIFFTDRGIYRPGQTIHFKGIVLHRFKGKSAIVPKYSTTVVLRDANYQDVSKLKLTSNEFGTFHGSFVIPQGLMNGQFSLVGAHGSAEVSVEDYKRPKFEVNFEPVKGSFKLGAEVKVSGKAVAYAGSNIDGAEVKYRVVRRASFPYWGYWGWGRIMPSSPEMEITSGGTTTDANGAFEIKFDAIPDPEISAELKPQFSYTVYADVVDITGETQSNSNSVNVGYLALAADLTVPEILESSQKAEFAIQTRNLNGEFEAAKGKISIHKLEAPERIFRERLWSRPDKFVLTQAEYYAKFPSDVYQNEDDFRTWKKEKEVFQGNFDSEKDDTLEIKNLRNWDEGKYVVELNTKDKFGGEVKVVKYFTLYEKASKNIPLPETEWFTVEKTTAEPGEKVAFYIGTAQKSLRVLYEIEKRGEIVSRKWLELKGEKKRFEIPVEEADRGNFTFHLSTVKQGRFYSHVQPVYVPWTNKKLKIAFETFRDKLQPGQKEEWKIRISGHEGDAAAAEMVAGMYDASLDAFRAVSWGLDVNTTYYTRRNWRGSQAFSFGNSQIMARDWNRYESQSFLEFDRLNLFGYSTFGGYYGWADRTGRGGVLFRSSMAEDEMDMEAMPMEEKSIAPPSPAASTVAAANTGTGTLSFKDTNQSVQQEVQKSAAKDMGGVKVRTNLNELAFFYPQLRTNENGEIIVSYTVPEALTRWRIMLLAHTKDLKTGYSERSLVTQKELMVMPNPPRFFRESDEIYFTAKVSNLSGKNLSGTAQLELFDAITMKPIDSQLENQKPQVSFTAKKGQSAPLAWRLKIPSGIQAVTFRVKAKAGDYTDGEESALPVLTNTMLVTEAMPLPVRPRQKKTFSFDKLRNNKSTTLRNHKYTLEFSSNPAWYAVQALPYLIEYPYECTEQVFSRYYANALASHIANSHPRIKAVFDAWKSSDKEAFLSNLEKNQELKSLLLEETPWVLNAQDESERKKRVGLLFDLNQMSNELNRALTKIQKTQVSNGGWSWFPGMPESRYITQHVVTGMGHLDHLGVKTVREDSKSWNMLKKAVQYLDTRIREDYEHLLKYKADLKKNHLGNDQVQYLYARSYFLDIPISKSNQKAFDYYSEQAKTYWLEQGRYLQGMIALALHRQKVDQVPMDIIKSLKERALTSEEMGMYWKETNRWCIYWYQAPIETQALLIEAFDEVANDQESVEEMKIWLLKQKQTQDWKTTKATVEACYALLLQGTDLLAESQLAEITVGGKVYDPVSDPATKVEAGTGYFKTSWMGGEITPKMGEVKVKNPNNVAAWGAVYWQYFEQLDKITFAETNLKLDKQLFLEKNTPTGPKITPVTEETKLKPGDRIKVRVVLETDRDLEYVHLKDMRAAGFEPINVMSQYKFQDGLGYYESTRDAATNFFIYWMPKGKYVFEYPLRVNHRGDFSNGITSVQCMYAPEFVAHSAGIRVHVGE